MLKVHPNADEVAKGWASAQVGEDPSGYGVAVETWSKAIDNGKEVGFFHWVFPFVKTRLTGDRVIENGLLATTFEGFGLGNINFRNGPDGAWNWPAATDRPYLYARSQDGSDRSCAGSSPTRLLCLSWTPACPLSPSSDSPIVQQHRSEPSDNVPNAG